MTRRSRRIFFYSSILFFLLLSPLIIGYSLGYTLNPTKGIVEKTGGIFIKSKTPRLSIFLNAQFVKQTSFLSGGALLTDIIPGTHLLRLEKANYIPWSKTIVVDPETVTELRNIILVPRPVPIATSTPDEVAMIRARMDIKQIRVAIPGEKMIAPDLPTPAPTPYFFLDQARNLIGKTATTSVTLAPHVNSFGFIDGTVFFIDKNGFLGRIDPGSGAITTIGRPGFYLSDIQAKFDKAPNGDIIIRDASGGCFLSDGLTNIKALTGGVRDIAFDNDGEKMLLRKDNSVDIVFLADNRFQPFQKRGTREQIFSSNAPIQDADWFFGDNAHIIVRTTDGIFFTETNGTDGKNTVQLFDKKTDDIITFPDVPNSMFFRRGKIFYTITL